MDTAVFLVKTKASVIIIIIETRSLVKTVHSSSSIQVLFGSKYFADVCFYAKILEAPKVLRALV